MKRKLGLLGLGNLMGNIYKVINGEISKETYRSKLSFLRNEQLIATYKTNFTNT